MSCPTCTTADRRGYCAPLRCYCGHEDCHAFASWTNVRPSLDNVQPIRPVNTTWSDREESTWIDKL